MAFDGPGPFDGDPVYNFIDGVSNQPPDAIQGAMAAAFRTVIAGGAAAQLPPELVSMLGIDPSSLPGRYADVDEGVWAWACAEMLALALGHEPETPIPAAFHAAALSLPRPRSLVGDALKALEIVADPKRSELAALFEEAKTASVQQRIGSLAKDLREHHLRSV